MELKKFPFYKQSDAKDCGPTCLRIICRHYNKIIPLSTIRDLANTSRDGSSLLGISQAAESIGFRTLGVKINYTTLLEDVPFPCIVHWNKYHFVVIYKIKNDTVYISDPAFGLIKYGKDEFIRLWIGENASDRTEEGISLILEPSPSFHSQEWDENEKKTGWPFLFKYLIKYKYLVLQIFVGLLVSSLLSLIFPFLTQSIVDVGIQNNDLNFIYLILFGQIMLFIGRTGIEVIRGWILLHLSTRVSISFISDFFIKLMSLPISFFDTRITGDIMQRINDNYRVEKLLTNSSISTLFSVFNLLIFSLILFFYDPQIFYVYIIGTLLYVTWILFFLKKRKVLDYKRFSSVAQEQGKVIEIINGMQEIKMHNAERQKRWAWEFIQIKLFKIKIKSLALEQWQLVGGNFINQMKDIFVTFLSAKLVLSGDLTLGMMLSVQYIIGQLNSPLVQLVDFIRQGQDAKISLERLSEIYNKNGEESASNEYTFEVPNESIQLQNVSFKYSNSDSFIFDKLNLNIPYKKTTAIVGASGSGKTTLLKLLMKFYDPNEGDIKIGSVNLKNISPKAWRDVCGVVMQEGYVFNDTIAGNIAIGEDFVDKVKLKKAVDVANIRSFIEELPLSYNTKIGNEGIGISGGQKQRLFIARAVYKSPEYIFFDEATSALDANNEKIIMENLEFFFRGKTAVIIAHRLSTVKSADHIVVLDRGQIVEEGTHVDLVALKGEYYRLVKNQLELGN